MNIRIFIKTILRVFGTLILLFVIYVLAEYLKGNIVFK